MSNDVGLRISRVMVFVKKCWIATLIGAMKFAMRMIALLVKLKACLSVSVGRLR